MCFVPASIPEHRRVDGGTRAGFVSAGVARTLRRRFGHQNWNRKRASTDNGDLIANRVWADGFAGWQLLAGGEPLLADRQIPSRRWRPQTTRRRLAQQVASTIGGNRLLRVQRLAQDAELVQPPELRAARQPRPRLASRAATRHLEKNCRRRPGAHHSPRAIPPAAEIEVIRPRALRAR